MIEMRFAPVNDPFNFLAISRATDSNFGWSSGFALPNLSTLKKYQYASIGRAVNTRACVVPKFMILLDRLVITILLPDSRQAAEARYHHFHVSSSTTSSDSSMITSNLC